MEETSKIMKAALTFSRWHPLISFSNWMPL